MDEFFTYDNQHQEQPLQYAPPNHHDPAIESHPAYQFEQHNANNEFNFNVEPSTQPPSTFQGREAADDFNDFEEDEMTKRIREEQERIQNLLRQKSQQEWSEKTKRKEEGRRQFEEYLTKKQQEKRERAQENIKKQADAKEESAKLNVEAGWKKVTLNINSRQGDYKGKKDVNRMREAILHRRSDDPK